MVSLSSEMQADRFHRGFNLLLYQAGWFAVVGGVAAGYTRLGSAVALTLLAAHILLATEPWTQFRIALAGVIVGVAVDTSLLALGIMTYREGLSPVGLPPAWLSILWAQFATTLPGGFRWLTGNLLTAACLGFCGAPLAFRGGEALGVVTMHSPRTVSYLWLAVAWAVAVPLLCQITRRLVGQRPAGRLYRPFRADPRPAADMRSAPASDTGEAATRQTGDAWSQPRPVHSRPDAGE